ncbi:hypothetical protein KI387_018389, partial [Taxus chinensis]
IKLAAVLTQEESNEHELPIAFMSYILKDHELKYTMMEKHAFAVVKAVKQFRFYILNSHSMVLVPDTTINSILTQQEFGSKRGNWVAKVQEYDIDIKSTKLVRGKGFCELIVEGAKHELLEEKVDLPTVLFLSSVDEWYADITHFLTYGECPSHLTTKEKRTVKLRSVQSCIKWENALFKCGLDGITLKCVDKEQLEKLLLAFHDQACGGNYSSDGYISLKILREDTTGLPCSEMHPSGWIN